MEKQIFLRQNMQIPQESVYTGVSIVEKFNGNIDDLSKYYDVHNIDEVKKFINQNNGLLEYINAITPLINDKFHNYRKCLTFNEDPEFEGLNSLIIYVDGLESEFERDWEKLNELQHRFFHMSEFTPEIMSLVLVDL